MQEFDLTAEERKGTGRAHNKSLRRAGMTPAILYGADKDPQSLQISTHTLDLFLQDESFVSHIINLKIGRREQKVLLRDLHRHPFKPVVLHVDFMRVSQKSRITVHVPFHFIHQDSCAGVKNQGGLLNHLMVESEIFCLPSKLPPFIEVDVGDLRIGHALHLKEVPLPEGVSFVALMHDEISGNLPVVSVTKARGVAAETTTEESEEDTEAEE